MSPVFANSFGRIELSYCIEVYARAIMSFPFLFFFNRCTFAHLYRPKKPIIPRFKPVSHDIPEQKAAAIYSTVLLDCNHEKRRRHFLSALKSTSIPVSIPRFHSGVIQRPPPLSHFHTESPATIHFRPRCRFSQFEKHQKQAPHTRPQARPLADYA